ncbi:putative hydrolase of the HAD superfamily [Amycolatopsis lexingtonensis]|uniref:Hydrolase of the HAD superfamily n=1 Tax=Amycolatopsis lexingtonensis TaxID=218822 RepID=A0ABR9IHJ4_9PSEU|nr:HAD family phosphatase [Amycolatopsis lexingtonensis]MBE1502636.1 putative hydrolase of the HAD superfamily [Amycolatopsis lexingtonensis]
MVFDVGGVLEITREMDVGRRWEDRLGLPAGEIGRRLADVWAGGAVGTVTERMVHQAIRDRLGFTGAQVEAMMAEMWVRYLGVGNNELIEYVRQLRPRYRTGILSNSFVGAREREQEKYRFEELVDEIVYSHEVGMSKPDPRIYELTCARLGVVSEEMVFVDDVESNIASAREAGIHAILYRDNAQAIAEIETALRRKR